MPPRVLSVVAENALVYIVSSWSIFLRLREVGQVYHGQVFRRSASRPPPGLRRHKFGRRFGAMDLSHILTVVASLTGLSVILSAVGCVIAFRQCGGGGFRAFCAYCLPRDLITCRSCWQDVGFILVKQLVRPWTTAVVLLFASANCALAVYGALVFAFGPRTQGAMSPLLFGTLLLAAVLIQDFLRFGSHYFLHRIGVLWDAHKVHHSASFLDSADKPSRAHHRGSNPAGCDWPRDRPIAWRGRLRDVHVHNDDRSSRL